MRVKADRDPTMPVGTCPWGPSNQTMRQRIRQRGTWHNGAGLDQVMQMEDSQVDPWQKWFPTMQVGNWPGRNGPEVAGGNRPQGCGHASKPQSRIGG